MTLEEKIAMIAKTVPTEEEIAEGCRKHLAIAKPTYLEPR
jgi:hypothetical protein